MSELVVGIDVGVVRHLRGHRDRRRALTHECADPNRREGVVRQALSDAMAQDALTVGRARPPVAQRREGRELGGQHRLDVSLAAEQARPRLVTTTWYSALSNTTSAVERLSEIVGSGDTLMLVLSLSVLLSGVASPPPLTETTLVRLDALGSTLTSNVMSGNDAPGARLSLRRHVIVRAATRRPAAAAGDRRQLAGMLSTTTTSPTVGAAVVTVMWTPRPADPRGTDRHAACTEIGPGAMRLVWRGVVDGRLAFSGQRRDVDEIGRVRRDVHDEDNQRNEAPDERALRARHGLRGNRTSS